MSDGIAEREELLFDWDGTHQPTFHIDELLATVERSTSDSLEAIWARRAVKLAQAPHREELGERINLVLVQLGRETYGLDAHYVWDIQPLTQCTPVPRVPKWVIGVVNRRGRIYSVVDLLRFFKLPQQEKAQTPELVMVETPNMELGLLVDRVLGVEAVPISQLQKPKTVRGLPPEYVQGVADYVGHDGTEFGYIMVLDLDALLADQRLVIHEEIL